MILTKEAFQIVELKINFESFISLKGSAVDTCPLSVSTASIVIADSSIVYCRRPVI